MLGSILDHCFAYIILILMALVAFLVPPAEGATIAFPRACEEWRAIPLPKTLLLACPGPLRWLVVKGCTHGKVKDITDDQGRPKVEITCDQIGSAGK